ncbi:50S ribosomal protein L35ae [Candidatus Bathyarchaeota archaeon]|nr:MAG: 50S ribosomal protein L35ae [Candidatus Bathyarchaeota archaeon]
MTTLYGVIVNYRVGPKTQRPKECLVKFPNVDTAEKASRLIGRKVAWHSEKKRIIGKVVATHGTKGLVRVRFRRGVPGQALGTYVRIIG